jgi:CRP-like cAMP-binding protein
LPSRRALRDDRGVASLTRKEAEKRIRVLRDRLEKAQGQRNDPLCDVILEELETLEPDNARWPHRRADLLRKMSRVKDAVHCYERAVSIYMSSGFLPRAIAMAKVLVELDPSRATVLEQVDPSAARALHRRVRPEGVRVADVAQQSAVLADAAVVLDPDESAPPNEVRFSAPPPSRRTLELDITDIELDEPLPAGASELDPIVRSEAERQACLPLLPLLAEAPPDALRRLVRESELVRVEDGAVVVRLGDPADALFGIVEGAVRVCVPGLPPEERPRLDAGDIFGEACLLGTEPRRADVVAEGALTALRIPKQTLTELVRAHRGVGDVLFEMLTRRLLANLLRTSRVFAELGVQERREIAGEFELRRARAGTPLVVAGKQSDALYITLTGHVEVVKAGEQAQIAGAGLMFGHASMLEGSPCTLGVCTLDTLLVLRLPRQAFARVAMQYPAMLMRLAELEPVAHVGQ